MTHSAHTLATFTGSGEPRIVFARKADGSVAFMSDGEAQVFKQLRSEGEKFTCVVPDCAKPALTVHDRRGRKRDGFSHLGGGSHGMGLAHLQSQLVITQWLADRYPGLRVEMEASTADGCRRADVLATSTTTGQQIAFEVQYSYMTVEHWTERHESYKAAGIVDVWLWGHVGEQMTKGSRPETVMLSSAQRAAAAAGLPLLWINPEDRLIGHVEQELRSSYGHDYGMFALTSCGTFTVETIDDFYLTRDREFTSSSVTSYMKACLAHLAKEKRERERREAADAEKKVRIDAFIQRMARKRESLLPDFFRTPMAQWVRKEFSEWPSWLAFEPRSGRTTIHLPIPPEMWQATFYREHIHGRPDRHHVNAFRMQQRLSQMDPDVRLADSAVLIWLDELTRRGKLTRTFYGETVRYRVVGVPSLAEPKARLLSLQQLDMRGISIPTSVITEDGQRWCPACGSVLRAQESRMLGYHRDCADRVSEIVGVNVTVAPSPRRRWA